MGSPEFYPLYEEAQRLNTAGVTIDAFGGDEPGSEVFEQFTCLHTTGHRFPSCASYGDGFRQHPEEFPKLKVGDPGVGLGWLPYWAERMDEEWEKRGKVEAAL